MQKNSENVMLQFDGNNLKKILEKNKIFFKKNFRRSRTKQMNLYAKKSEKIQIKNVILHFYGAKNN